MKKNHIWIYMLIFALIALIIGSCTPQKPDQQQLLNRNWHFVAIKNTQNELVKPVAKGDFMLLNSGQFIYELTQAGIKAKGSYIIKADTLIFLYQPADKTAKIDSVALQIKDGVPLIEYFSDGHVEATVQANQIATEKIMRYYRIDNLTETQLTLSEGDVRYQFAYVPETLGSATVSMSGIINGLIGVTAMILLLAALSENRKKINWRLVLTGVFLQILFAVLVLKVPFVRQGFEQISKFFVAILGFTKAGSEFLFGGLVGNIESYGFIFVFQVLPTIIFFAALTSLLYYLNILQKIIYVFAWIMSKTMRLSGAESMAAAANIFLGQTEAPLLVKPYIEKMTRSEIMALMSGGMATIAGGVLAAYIGFLGGADPVQQQLFATHLLSASIMSAPASLLAAKILIPETETFEKNLLISKDKIGSNVLDAIANGTTDGLKLAVNVGAMLLVFTAFMAMLNFMFKELIGETFGLNASIVENSNGKYDGLSLQYVLGKVFAPVAWLLGVRNPTDLALVGQLLGEKTILNEFFAYVSLGNMKNQNLFADTKSIIIATYALCGFANFASIGIQIGGIGSLAPDKRPLLSSLGVKALIAGTAACLLTGAIAGMLS